ncbi:hypothetical protein ACFVUY_26470 [Kitasatospora sp. NPDC058063]|uniref:hypothetical protein n=1 Tax=unclassified Kitasatospora TaxID=2633591 RepID=UPI0036DD97D6
MDDTFVAAVRERTDELDFLAGLFGEAAAGWEAGLRQDYNWLRESENTHQPRDRGHPDPGRR